MRQTNMILLILAAVFVYSCQSSQKPVPFSEGEFKNWAQTPPMGWNSWDCYGPTV